MSNSLQTQGLQPVKFLCPCKFLGKNTGEDCHFILQGIFLTQGLNLGFLHCREILYSLSHQRSPPKVKVLVTQSCLNLCYPMDCHPSGSPLHGILQARILKWIVIPFSKGSSWPRDQTQVSCIAGRFFTSWATKGRFSNQGRDLIYPIFLELWLLMYSTGSSSWRTRAGEKNIPPHLVMK